MEVIFTVNNYKIGHAIRRIGVRKFPWIPWVDEELAGYLKPGDTIGINDMSDVVYDWHNKAFIHINSPINGYLNIQTWYDSFTDDERGQYGGPDIRQYIDNYQG